MDGFARLLEGFGIEEAHVLVAEGGSEHGVKLTFLAGKVVYLVLLCGDFAVEPGVLGRKLRLLGVDHFALGKDVLGDHSDYLGRRLWQCAALDLLDLLCEVLYRLAHLS